MLDQFETVGEFEMVASSLNGVLGQSELSHGDGMDQLVAYA